MSQRDGQGKLVVLEGIDGAGKTTQEALLCVWLQNRGKSVLLTKQPTDWYRSNDTVSPSFAMREGLTLTSSVSSTREYRNPTLACYFHFLVRSLWTEYGKEMAREANTKKKELRT
jgi:thymidylate kinase-like protein